MKIRTHIYGFVALAMLTFLSGCTEGESFIDGIVGDDPDIIHIGGIENATVDTSLGGFTTRAAGDNAPVDAETVEWLLGPLFGGLDITYGAKDKPETEAVAILKLLKKDENKGNTPDNIKYSQYSNDTEKIAEYSFKYLANGNDAKWYDNGEHYFQGVFVPEKLRYKLANSETATTVNDPTNGKAANLKFDQSKDDKTQTDANYTLLERYLGMPADAMLHATVGRIKLPFRHRLARVKAYVLIDPTMGNAVTINGYKKDKDTDGNAYEDASSSDIRFCNVDVLSAVEEKASSTTGHNELIPRWEKARKVIPHFVEECGSKNSLDEVKNDDFLMFYNTELKTYIFPSDDEEWATAKKAWDDAYTEALKDGTSAEEMRRAADTADKNSGYKRTNYGKVPVYDLIVRPTYKSEDMVMYDEDLTGTSIADLVELHNNIDFEITLNNGLEYFKSFPFNLDANFQNYVYLRINRESIDYNSSGAETWTEGDPYNDGHYGVNNQNGNTLSFAGSSWQRAYRIGSTNPNITDGHYYGQDDTTDDNAVQDDDNMPWYPQYVDTDAKWIKMFAQAHADGLHHGDYFILDKDITIDAKALPANFVFTGHLDGQDHTITLTGMGEKVVDEAAWVEPLPETLYRYVDAVLYTQPEIDAAKEIVNADGYVAGTNPEAETVANKTTSDVKIDAHYESFNPTSWSQIEDATEELFIDDQGTPYVAPDPIHHPEISHISGSTLFAGLNGAYAAAIGEANVHSENGILVPYVDATTGTGWRAEVINTKISGAEMFPIDAVVDGNYNVNNVSGYIYNCWKVTSEGREKIKPHTPTLPKYK